MAETNIQLNPTPPDAIQQGLKDVSAPAEQSFIYKGIEINGIDQLEEHGTLTRQDVTDLIDRLPEAYFKKIPLGTINFEPYKMFSVERDGKVLYVKEADISPSDTIIARKRGVTHWNSKMVDTVAVPTDGKMTISIFSPINWDGRNDRHLDHNTALYSLAHELGHTVWGAIIYGPGIFGELQRLGVPLPCSQDAVKLLPLIEKWKSLPVSTMQRYQDYKDVFSREHDSDSTGYLKASLDELSNEEDFTISCEFYLFWQNLQNIDQQRHQVLQDVFQGL